jgi:hypothetical protein
MCSINFAHGQPRGLINKNDTLLFLPYQNGLVTFSVKGKMGVLDSTGHVILQARYSRLTKAYEDQGFFYRFYEEGKKRGVLTKDFQVIIPTGRYDEIDILINGFFRVKKDGQYTYVNNQGAEIGSWFKDAKFFFRCGLAAVQVGAKWGFINTMGQMIIEPQFQQTSGFCENGLAAVRVGGKWGFIDDNGNKVIPPMYERARCFWNGLAAVKKGNKWGYIDRSNNTIIPFEYSKASSFDNCGMSCVKKDGRYGFIDKQNNVVIPFKYYNAYGFGENALNTSVKTRRFGKWIRINRKDECIMSCD